MATIKKTSTPAIQTLQGIAKAEAKLSQDAYAEAKVLYREREQALASADDNVARIHSFWNKGDDTFRADDMVQAKATVDRAKALFGASERDVKRTQRALINLDLHLAEAIAEGIEKAVGVKPILTAIAPSEAPGDLPVLYLLQPKAASIAESGLVKGEAEIVYFHTQVHRTLDAQQIEVTADRLDQRVQAREVFSEVSDGIIRDSLNLIVHRAYGVVPRIAGVPTSDTAKSCAHTFAARMSERAQRYDGPTQGVSIGNGDSSARRVTVRGEGLDGTVLSTNVSEGIRTTRVNIAFGGVRDRDQGVTYEEIKNHLMNAAEAQVGQVIGNLGRIESVTNVEITPWDSAYGTFGRVLTATVTAVSEAF